MKVLKIRINTIDDVKKFVNIVTKYEFDIDVVSGRYAIDAKSIMGLFSLDLSKDVEIKIHSDDNEDIVAELQNFIV